MYFDAPVLILEDDLLVAQQIKAILENNGLGIACLARTKQEALDITNSLEIGLLIADIGLANDDCGIETAVLLRKKQSFPIIFLTGKTDSFSIEKLKRAKPSAYLSKPFRPHELIANIDIAYNSFFSGNIPRDAKYQDHLFIPYGKGYKRVAKADIMYFEADGSYVKLFTPITSYLVSTNIGNIEKQLGHGEFIRISRKHLINSIFISGIENNCVCVNSKCFPIGEAYKHSIASFLPLIRTK